MGVSSGPRDVEGDVVEGGSREWSRSFMSSCYRKVSNNLTYMMMLCVLA